MIIHNYENLVKLREKHKDEKIAFCSGVFDLTHAGHVLFFEDCKREADILFVAVGGDNLIRRYKGTNRPIMNEHIRLKMIDSLKPVDYTIINQSEDPDLLASLYPILSRLKPDIYVVNEDAFGLDNRERLAKEFNLKLKVCSRYCPKEFENISTTGLIKKIKEC